MLVWLVGLMTLYGAVPSVVCGLVFGTDASRMCAIAYRESRFQDVSNGEHIGWWQINRGHLDRLGLSEYDLHNPYVNALVARELARERPDLADWIETR